MDEQLKAISAQLESLQAHVRSLADKAAEERASADGSASKLPGDKQKQGSPTPTPDENAINSRALVARSMSLEAFSSEDDSLLLRPAKYPHAPAARLDGLERERFGEQEVLDALKLESFEGFYNLAMLLLTFAMVCLPVRHPNNAPLHF
jgi:hypothetical protein